MGDAAAADSDTHAERRTSSPMGDAAAANSDTDDDIFERPTVQQRGGANSSAAHLAEHDGRPDAEAEKAARVARAALQKAAAAARSKKLPPPTLGWRWEPAVLQADGATAVDLAAAKVFAYDDSTAVDAAGALNNFTLRENSVEYWKGAALDELCEVLMAAKVLSLDLEWLQHASSQRPRPGEWCV